MLAKLGVAQSEWLIPPDDLVLTGVPSIPASFSKSLQRSRVSSPDTLVGWDTLKIEPTFIHRYYSGPSFVATVSAPGAPVKQICFSSGIETYSNRQKGYFVFEMSNSIGGVPNVETFRRRQHPYKYD